MNLPPAIEQMTSRFDAMSIRERALVACALLAAIIMTWMLAVLDPISGQERALSTEKMALEEQISSAKLGIETANATDPTTIALAKEKKLQTSLDEINTQLASKSAGLIPPERMVQVIRDVLGGQHGVTLVSLHNKPMTSLVQSVAPANAKPSTDGAATASAASDSATGPFVHPVEIVVEVFAVAAADPFDGAGHDRATVHLGVPKPDPVADGHANAQDEQEFHHGTLDAEGVLLP